VFVVAEVIVGVLVVPVTEAAAAVVAVVLLMALDPTTWDAMRSSTKAVPIAAKRGGDGVVEDKNNSMSTFS
jgi:hypothetical protein